MKIGVSSYSMSAYRAQTGASYVDLCVKAKELGFDGIEFTDLGGDEIEEARKIRDMCEEIGLPVAAYTIGANMLAENIDAEVERLCRKVDTAVALGAPVMRHDAAFALKDKPGYTWEDAIPEMAPAIRRVTEYAASKGVRTCTENHGYIFQDSTRVEKLMQAVNHPNYGWLVDMGNFLCADENPADAVARAAKYAFHCHAKDFLYKKAADLALAPEGGFFKTRNGNYLRGTVVGHGEVPVPVCVRTLKAAGYDGWLSLEFEGMENNIPALEAGLAYLRKVVAL